MNKQIFISYSHKDEKWKNLLVKHLNVLEDQLEVWEDSKIQAGEEWGKEIETAMKGAHAAILLLSVDFLTSGFIKSVEGPALLQRRAAEKIKIFPLILRPCPWDDIPWLASLQVWPKGAVALSTLEDSKVETVLVAFCREIKNILGNVGDQWEQAIPRPPGKVEGKREEREAGNTKLSFFEEKISKPVSSLYDDDFIGREQEIGRLKESLDKVKGGSGQAVFVRGEAGVGKSRFVQHFMSRQDDCFHLTGSFPSKKTSSMQAVRQMLMTFFQGSKHSLQTPSIMEQEIHDTLGRLFEGDAPNLEQFLVGFMLGHSISESELEVRFMHWFNLFSAIAKMKPLILYFDDIQWGDPATYDLIFDMMWRLKEWPAPILILATFRDKGSEPGDEDRENIDYLEKTIEDHEKPGSNVSLLELGGMAPDEAEAYFNSKFKQNEFLPWFLPEVLEISKRNPFFMKELVALLVRDKEVFQDKQGIWRLNSKLTRRGLNHLVPKEVKDILQRRIREIKQVFKKVLEMSAAIGNPIYIGLLEKIYEENLTELEDALMFFEEEELMGESNEKDSISFTHPLFPEVICQELKKKTIYQKQIYRQIAEAFQQVYPTDVVKKKLSYDYAVILEKSGQQEEAVHWFLAAGIKEVNQFNYRDALVIFVKLKKLNEPVKALSNADEAALLIKMAECFDIIGKWNEAIQSLSEAMDINGDDLHVRTECLINIGKLHEKKGEFDRSIDYCDKAIKIALSNDLKNEAGLAYTAKGRCFFRKSDYDAALEVCRFAKDLFDTQDDEYSTGIYLRTIGIVYSVKGDLLKAIQLLEEALDIAVKYDNNPEIARCRNSLGIYYRKVGEYQKAIKHLEGAIKINQDIGDKYWMSANLSNLNRVHQDLGNYEKSIKYCKKALELKLETGNRQWEASCLNEIAKSKLNMGYIAQALELNRESLRITEEINTKSDIQWCLMDYGRSYQMIFSRTEALKHHHKALKIAQEVGTGIEYTETLHLLGADYLITKDFETAQKYLDEALSLSREGKLKQIETAILTTYAEYYLQLGDLNKAAETASELLAIVKETGQLWETSSALRVLGEIEFLNQKYPAAIKRFKDALLPAAETKSPFLLWPVTFALSRCLGALGEPGEAVDYLEKAKSYINFIASNIPDKNLAENFLNAENTKKVLRFEPTP